MPAVAPIRIDTVGTTSSPQFNRWLVLHRPSKLEHETTGTAQYAHPALALAIEEGFASKLFEAGYGFPSFSECEFVEIIEAEDPKFGRIA